MSWVTDLQLKELSDKLQELENIIEKQDIELAYLQRELNKLKTQHASYGSYNLEHWP
jgi:uncharacterized coiled-coil protein SlyX